MSSYNKVILMGNLTRDPETREVGSTTICSFGLAVSRKFRTADGQDREEVCFVDVDAWSKSGEVIARYFGKGKPILIEGRLKLDQWENQSGEKRSKLKVIMERFEFVGSRDDRDDGQDRGRDSGQDTGGRDDDDDDIPF